MIAPNHPILITMTGRLLKSSELEATQLFDLELSGAVKKAGWAVPIPCVIGFLFSLPGSGDFDRLREVRLDLNDTKHQYAVLEAGLSLGEAC
jgi:hypothetical protein